MNVTIEQVRTAVHGFVTAGATGTAAAGDIRELSYQGKVFSYPCIRYEVTCDPDECDNYDVNFTLWVFSEDASSLEVTQIVDQLIAALHDRRYTGAIQLQNVKVISAPAPLRGEILWRGALYCTCLATR